jgi:hypothetical protein
VVNPVVAREWADPEWVGAVREAAQEWVDPEWVGAVQVVARE